MRPSVLATVALERTCRPSVFWQSRGFEDTLLENSPYQSRSPNRIRRTAISRHVVFLVHICQPRGSSWLCGTAPSFDRVAPESSKNRVMRFMRMTTTIHGANQTILCAVDRKTWSRMGIGPFQAKRPVRPFNVSEQSCFASSFGNSNDHQTAASSNL